MKLERLEVRLRPMNPAEAELIDALEEKGSVYGGKNELMRECLRRGYTALKQKMENLSVSGDEVATLDALAQTFASGEYGYRVVKTYLDARSHANSGPIDSRHKAVETTAAAAPVAPVAPVEPVEPVEPPVATPPPSVVVSSAMEPSAPAEQGGKRKVDWSRMRGLAGVGGDESGGS